VSSPRVPVRIRQALNVESGLNDGIALPLLLCAVSLGTMAEHATDVSYWLRFAAFQVGLGPLVGIAVGFLDNVPECCDSTQNIETWLEEALQLSPLRNRVG
jgi:NhaP-type Na+/H+ or K+/H+ antiporter